MSLFFGDQGNQCNRYFAKDRICLFDLILYVPVNSFSVMSGRVFLG